MLKCDSCSLDESVQDPMVFSLLELISFLCSDRLVPSDAWDFILCALVTITHVCQLVVYSSIPSVVQFFHLLMYCNFSKPQSITVVSLITKM